MAFNPSPEVAVARDAANKLGQIMGVGVDQCIVLFITKDRRSGYASFGQTRALCDEAKALADSAHEAMVEKKVNQ